jgi:hypothetical protein
MSRKLLLLALVAGVTTAAAGCGEFIRQDRSSVTLVIDSLLATSGADDSAEPSGTLQSDVVTVVENTNTVFNDSGQVSMRLIMKDPVEVASPTNAVTISRYQVTFRRADGRNTPGVDVPFPFDSAITFTIASGQTVTAGFELIRHVAKLEAPLFALRTNPVFISTIADITFFGRDQAGRNVSTSGSIGIQFGNFGDPD